jgi:hypothetical protein
MKYLKYFENNKNDFYYFYNRLTTLKKLKLPKEIYGNLNCAKNKIKH